MDQRNNGFFLSGKQKMTILQGTSKCYIFSVICKFVNLSILLLFLYMALRLSKNLSTDWQQILTRIENVKKLDRDMNAERESKSLLQRLSYNTRSYWASARQD